MEYLRMGVPLATAVAHQLAHSCLCAAHWRLSAAGIVRGYDRK